MQNITAFKLGVVLSASEVGDEDNYDSFLDAFGLVSINVAVAPNNTTKIRKYREYGSNNQP